MLSSAEKQDAKPYLYLSWIGIAVFAFGLGLFLGTFGGVFDLYDQVEPLVNSGAISEAQGKSISTVPGSVKVIMLTSAVVALAGLLSIFWTIPKYLRLSKS